ncbi:MAG: ATP-binding protein [Bacteroidales bacterium]|nr:ATP-binding protein [Bacteroidales bacterium]
MNGKSIMIGREREMAELQRCVDSDRSEFVIVYGRRRVGKTYLVDQFFHHQFDFSYTGGHRLPKAKQLRNFGKALKKYAMLERQPKFSDWDDAFDALEEYLEAMPDDKRKVIFFDEMPWIDTPQSEFVDALEMFWNGWASRRNDIVFVASGSSTSWMVDKLVENQGGLHGRITSNIYVRPFTLHETEEYLNSRKFNWDRYQMLQTYMILGGIPFYYSLLNPKESLVQNVDRLFFRKNGELKTEFEELYHSLFSHAEKYTEIVKVLNDKKGGLTRDEMLNATGMDASLLTKVLRNLERCDFIIRYSQYGNKTKGAIYRLVDFYTLFYYRFVEASNGQDETWWSHNFQSRAVETWQGLSFELVCLLHLTQIKRRLGIAGIATEASSWRYVPTKKSDTDNEERGTQIDLLIDRADRVINLCEMKFSAHPYRITDDYEKLLRDRMETFRTKTKTTKALVHTFVTTFGVADGMYRSIVNSEVVMDGLFVE